MIANKAFSLHLETWEVATAGGKGIGHTGLEVKAFLGFRACTEKTEKMNFFKLPALLRRSQRNWEFQSCSTPTVSALAPGGCGIEGWEGEDFAAAIWTSPVLGAVRPSHASIVLSDEARGPTGHSPNSAAITVDAAVKPTWSNSSASQSSTICSA